MKYLQDSELKAQRRPHPDIQRSQASSSVPPSSSTPLGLAFSFSEQSAELYHGSQLAFWPWVQLQRADRGWGNFSCTPCLCELLPSKTPWVWHGPGPSEWAAVGEGTCISIYDFCALFLGTPRALFQCLCLSEPAREMACEPHCGFH